MMMLDFTTTPPGSEDSGHHNVRMQADEISMHGSIRIRMCVYIYIYIYVYCIYIRTHIHIDYRSVRCFRGLC